MKIVLDTLSYSRFSVDVARLALESSSSDAPLGKAVICELRSDCYKFSYTQEEIDDMEAIPGVKNELKDPLRDVKVLYKRGEQRGLDDVYGQ